MTNPIEALQALVERYREPRGISFDPLAPESVRRRVADELEPILQSLREEEDEREKLVEHWREQVYSAEAENKRLREERERYAAALSDIRRVFAYVEERGELNPNEAHVLSVARTALEASSPKEPLCPTCGGTAESPAGPPLSSDPGIPFCPNPFHPVAKDSDIPDEAQAALDTLLGAMREVRGHRDTTDTEECQA